jgi:hypothetical protein
MAFLRAAYVAPAAPIVQAMTSRASRVRAIDRSLVSHYAFGREWKASDRHAIADRAFKAFAAKVLPPRFRQAVNEQFTTLPLEKKVRWMRDARRIALAQDCLENINPKEKSAEAAELRHQVENLSGHFTEHWIRDLAMQGAFNAALKGGAQPDIKAELNSVLEDDEPSPHLVKTTKADQKILVGRLREVYQHIQQMEEAEGRDPHAYQVAKRELEAEISTLLKELGFKAHELPGLVVRIQEQFADFDMAREVDWRESTEWTLIGGRSLSTLTCLIVAALLCCAGEELKEILNREEREANLAAQNLAKEQMIDLEHTLSSLKVDISTTTSTLERLHLDKTDPELHAQILDELRTLNRHMSQVRKKLFDLSVAIPHLTVHTQEGFEREKNGIIHDLNRMKKTVLKRMGTLSTLSTEQAWASTKRDILLVIRFLNQSTLPPPIQKDLKGLIRAYDEVLKKEVTPANLAKLKKIHDEVLKLAESDVAMNPLTLQTASADTRKQLFEILTKF